MKKTYLVLLPLISLTLSGCPKTNLDPRENDDKINLVKEVRECVSAPYAEISGVVVEKGKSSYIVYDGTGLILHYSYKFTKDVTIGEKVTIKGQTGFKNGLAQFTEDDENTTVEHYDGDVPAFDFNATKIDDFNSFNPNTIEYISVENALAFEDIQVKWEGDEKKITKYYQTKVFDDGSEAYLSMGDSDTRYVEPLVGVEEKSALMFNIKGFVVGITPPQVATPTTRYTFLLDEAIEPVDVTVESVDLVDTNPYYNLTTTFNDYKRLDITAYYEEGFDRKVKVEDVTYEVFDSEGNKIDPRLPFTSAGTYKVKVTYEGVTSNEYPIVVYDNEDTVVHHTIREVAEMNNWKDNSSSTSKTGKLDDNITLEATGSYTNYSEKNGTWAINQASNGKLVVNALNNLYINKIFVRYVPYESDENREGKLEFLPKDTLVGVRKHSASYDAINVIPGVENASVRLTEIMVTYTEEPCEAPTLSNVKIKDDFKEYTTKSSFNDDNKLDVVATYSDNMQERIAKNDYTLIVKDSEGNPVNTSLPFAEVGTYTVQVIYNGMESNVLSFKVVNPVLEALNVTNDYDKPFTTLECFNDHSSLTVVADYSGISDKTLTPEQYTLKIFTPNGEEIEPTEKFPNEGKYTLKVYYEDAVGELKFDVIELDLTELFITDDFNEYTTFTKFDTTNQLKVYAKYSNYNDRELPCDEYEYVVKNSSGEAIDTSEFFPAAGTYNVSVTIDGVTSNTLEFEVVAPSAIIASKTPAEIVAYNEDIAEDARSFQSAKLDDNISLQIECGSSTGNYSKSNNTWTVVQKRKNGDPHDGALKIIAAEGFVIVAITVTYKPTSGSSTADVEANRVGHLDGLLDGERKEYDEVQSVLAEVIPENEGTTNANARISSITVEYKVA